MREVRVGVIGVGYLGGRHARVYRELEGAHLVGVADRASARAAAVASELGCGAYESSEALLAEVDAVSLAVPTPWHCREGLEVLRRGVHLLVEKPIASTVAEADELIDSARQKGLVLQVGHIERFRGAVQAALEIADNPRFLECHRLASFSPRGSEVAVVLDLMIHDVDIVLHLVRERVVRVDAVGVPVLTPYIDIANARLEFEKGAIANLTASRVSREKMRKIRFFQSNAYVSIDCLSGRTDVYRKARSAGEAGVMIEHERLGIEAKDSLREELSSFIDCVRTNAEPLVSGEVGRSALEIALRVVEEIERRREGVPNPAGSLEDP